jgi:hypothetical protein
MFMSTYMYTSLQSDVVEVVSKKWEELEDHMTPGVCLLVGAMEGDSKQTDANQQELLGWCVQNNFELIEWEKTTPTSTPENQDGNYACIMGKPL